MAPSRGIILSLCSKLGSRNTLVRSHSTFAQAASDSARKTQVYISRTIDPYVNLSIEHFLLQKSPPDSTVLFLYTNRPCIVIGRNQNPWVEVNLGLLGCGGMTSDKADEPISLVRRRSGGGTVFHDEGNVNYSVICPTGLFDRDKHAQMVVRALLHLGVDQARVNERHDIVLEQADDANGPSKYEGLTADATSGPAIRKPLKVSGSAYKLTRLRSLHHGTCLLSSPNIKKISQYLRSPAKPYIKARGVDSVSSPITNVNVPNQAFEKAVISEFVAMYDEVEPVMVSDEESNIPEISKGLREMRSLEWTYLQTPQFTFSSHATKEDPRERGSLPDFVPADVEFSFTARNGTIIKAEIAVHEDGWPASEDPQDINALALVQKKLHAIEDWREALPKSLANRTEGISRWLNDLFGSGPRKE